MRPIAVVPLLALAAALFAEDPPKSAFVVPHEWHGFKEGSWVEIRTKGGSSTGTAWNETKRWTLKSVADGGSMLEIATMKDGKSIGASADAALDSPVRESGLVNKGERDLKVGDKTFKCVVWETKPLKPGDDSTGQAFWVCPEAPVPGGFVRYEEHRDEAIYPVFVIRTLVGLDREVDVCGRKVKCAVWKETHARDGEITIVEIEDLRSSEVPGGLVSQKARRKTAGRDGMPDEVVDMTQEVTAVHLEGGTWAAEKK